MARLTFEEIFLFDIGSTAEHHARVSGRYVPGYRGDRIDPPEEASFEIDKVEVLIGKDWRELPDWLITKEQYEALSEAGLNAYVEGAADALERRAEMRREDSFFDSMVEICRPDAAE
jgi:hypothetical protein